MGGVEEIRFKYEASGYQYVGHCDSSLEKTNLHARHISLVFLLLGLYRHSMLRGKLSGCNRDDCWLGEIIRQLVRVFHKTSVSYHILVFLSEGYQTVFDFLSIFY